MSNTKKHQEYLNQFKDFENLAKPEPQSIEKDYFISTPNTFLYDTSEIFRHYLNQVLNQKL